MVESWNFMSRFATLFSGSSGNCTYIGDSDGGILIDAGFSAKRIVTGLLELGIDIKSIRALFITHEHNDHVSAVRVLCQKNNIQLYATNGTINALDRSDKICGVRADVIPESGVTVAGMNITNFHTPHDASESCGYIIHTSDERKIAVCTDLGYVTTTVRSAITGSDLVMLESNHDVGMLKNGFYPYQLKQRILGMTGHISNETSAAELENLLKNGATRFVLAHLSGENNYPELAYQTAKSALDECGATIDVDYKLCVAPKDKGIMIYL